MSRAERRKRGEARRNEIALMIMEVMEADTEKQVKEQGDGAMIDMVRLSDVANKEADRLMRKFPQEKSVIREGCRKLEKHWCDKLDDAGVSRKGA